MKKYILLAWLLVIFAMDLQGQEFITGLYSNKQVAKLSSNKTTYTRNREVHLPFWDDFSNYTGLPNPSLWQDNFAYVNRSFALRPPTIGVATLDALDDNGRIYARADGSGFQADYLTSLPIRLDYNFISLHSITIADSLYLSFYYQPCGGSTSGHAWERIGDRPENRDSLVLEFGYATDSLVFAGYNYCDTILEQQYIIGDTLFNPRIASQYYIFDHVAFAGDMVSLACDSNMVYYEYWEKMWGTGGIALETWLSEDSLAYFKQVMIPIVDEKWLRPDFQFRFRNRASLEGNGIPGRAGNVDQWNIDYVYLNVGRDSADTYHNDLAFVSSSTSLLKEYQSMPWSQYRDSDLATAFKNELISLCSFSRNCNYNYEVSKVGGGVVASLISNNVNIDPYTISGLHNYQQHTNPEFQFHSLPIDDADSAEFIVRHIFGLTGGDDHVCNDSCVFIQKFYNYYAYDDGSAEAGYSLRSLLQNPEAFLAVKFTLAQPDTLRSVRMWFNSVLDDENFEDFTLMVWGANANHIPDEILYEEDCLLPATATPWTDFVEYRLEEPIAISGTIFVGFRQNHAVELNLGFDQNTDSRGKWLYNIDGSWQESFLRGTPMIRPVVGKTLPEVGITDIEKNNSAITVYPNPVQTTLTVHISGETAMAYRLFDGFGRLLRKTSLNHTHDFSCSVSELPSGIYILQVVDRKGKIHTTKIIKH